MKKQTLLLLILLFSCQNTTLPSLAPYAIGTDGLTVNLETKTPNLIMCQQLDLLATLRNLGTFDIENGQYNLILEDQIFKADKKTKPFSLLGRSRYNPPGDLQLLDFKIKNIGLPEQLEQYATPAIFQTCYSYETHATLPVCIDPDITNTKLEKSCTPTDQTISGGQGAPIAITGIKTLMAPEEDRVIPTFVITVANLGLGRVTSPDQLSAACSGQQQELNSNPVLVSATLQDQPLSCTPKTINLDKDATLICTSSKDYGPEEGTFTTLLDLQLEYGYIQSTTIPLTITRIPGQKECT